MQPRHGEGNHHANLPPTMSFLRGCNSSSAEVAQRPDIQVNPWGVMEDSGRWGSLPGHRGSPSGSLSSSRERGVWHPTAGALASQAATGPGLHTPGPEGKLLGGCPGPSKLFCSCSLFPREAEGPPRDPCPTDRIKEEGRGARVIAPYSFQSWPIFSSSEIHLKKTSSL